MVAFYPGFLWPGQTTPGLQSDTPTHSDIHDRVAEEIAAIEAELGINPSGSSATVAARLTAIAADLATRGTDISAINTELGANPSGVSATVAARLTTMQAAIDDIDAAAASAIYDSGWLSATPATGFGTGCRYRRLGGQVTLAMSLVRTGATITSKLSSLLATIPVEFAPSQTVTACAHIEGPLDQCGIRVEPNGQIVGSQYRVDAFNEIWVNMSWPVSL